MSGISESNSAFEDRLERALLDRSQMVLAPPRMFESLRGQLGDQKRRSFVGIIARTVSMPMKPTRRVAVALAPLVAVLVFALLLSSSGVLFGDGSSVADAPTDKLTLDLGPGTHPVIAPQEVWTIAAGMNQPRQRHGSVSLHDGRILVFGGYNVDGPVMSTEIYDPNTEKWTTIGDFPYGLPNFKAPVVLNDGRVLVVGGSSAQKPKGLSSWYLRTSALFDPATSDWEEIEEFLAYGRRDAETVLLPDGQVLLYSGVGGRIPEFSREEIFNPDAEISNDRWFLPTDTPELPEEYLAWADVVRGSGITVIFDGQYRLSDDENPENVPEDVVISLNPDTRWISLPDTPNFGFPFAGELSNGRVMVGTGSLEVGAAGRTYFFDAGGRALGLSTSSGLVADNRELRVLATVDGYVHDVIEWWQDPLDSERHGTRNVRNGESVWSQIGNFPGPNLEDFSVTQLGSDKILITGGTNSAGSYSDASYILQLPVGE